MGPLLALAASLSWGLADFFGGLGSRRVGAVRIICVSYPAGAVLLTLLSLTLLPGVIDGTTLAWAVITGLIGLGAMWLFYLALASGPMGIISPITAVLSAAIPAVVGLLRGESLGGIAIAGIVVAVAAIVLVSREAGDHPAVTRRAIVLSLAAGVAIGLYLTGIGLAPAASGIWVVTLGRWAASAVIVVVALVVVRRTPPATSVRYPWHLAVAAGVLDCLANSTFQLAAQLDDLAIVAVIGSLYPAATVVLARYLLHERLSRVQVLGVILALVAAVALTAS